MIVKSQKLNILFIFNDTHVRCELEHKPGTPQTLATYTVGL